MELLAAGGAGRGEIPCSGYWTGISHSGDVGLAMGVRSYGSQKSYGLVKVKLSEFYFKSGIRTD